MKERRKDHSKMVASSSRSRCETIPEDVMFEILPWLPVRSLLRFKSVCKSWRSFIESSDFISQHLQLSNQQDNQENKLIVMSPHDSRNPYYSFTFNIISVNDLQIYKSVEFIPIGDSWRKAGEKLIASFDGIVCFKYKTRETWFDWVDVVSLWNPATKQITILPPLQSQIEENANFQISYGFGLDVKTNDYKVVRLGVILADHQVQHSEAKTSQVHVYSLRTDSWRNVDVAVPLQIYLTSNPTKPFRNEIYCWLGYEWDSRDNLILSFNFSDEAFEILPVPDDYTNHPGWILSLTFTMEKIACVADDGNCCKIWVMDEYGVKESWTNLYTLANPYTVVLDQIETALGFTVDGKLFFKNAEVEQLCVYDPRTKEIIDLPNVGHISDAAVYKESLVSARSANGVTNRVASEVLLSICTMNPNPIIEIQPRDESLDHEIANI